MLIATPFHETTLIITIRGTSFWGEFELRNVVIFVVCTSVVIVITYYMRTQVFLFPTREIYSTESLNIAELLVFITASDSIRPSIIILCITAEFSRRTASSSFDYRTYTHSSSARERKVWCLLLPLSFIVVSLVSCICFRYRPARAENLRSVRENPQWN